MQNSKISLPLDIYHEHLQDINGVEFTPREMDVIACLLNGRAGTSSTILSIKQRALETHTRNIRQKAGGLPGRESIVDFIEKSEKASFIKNDYYLNLQVRIFFENQLQIFKKETNKFPECLFIYEEESHLKPSLIPSLEKHLKLAGINVQRENKGIANSSFSHSSSEGVGQESGFVVCVASSNLMSLSQRAYKYARDPNKILFVFPEGKIGDDISLESVTSNFIDFREQQNYYLSFFEILKKLFPHHSIDLMISDFIEYCKKLCSSFEGTYSLSFSEGNMLKTERLGGVKRRPSLALFRFILKENVGFFLIGSLFLCLLGSLIFWVGETPKDNKLDLSQSIRSDLPIPAENALLDRPELLKEIETKFKGQMRGIKTLALLGIGGAGKTITARQYARSQGSPIVWEINAETQQSLLGSLETLAQSLATTEKDENVLKRLKDVKNSSEKEIKLLVFLKEKLKASPQWLLIFDNVENFTDIQPYFPQDVSNWGEGKILITTPNSNIQSNKNINNTVVVRELGKQQKLSFFMKLMQGGNSYPYTVDHLEEIREFLEGVPPFPLDLSIAAGYLKATHTTYKNYLEKLHKQDKGFVEVQENILRESGGYKNKRHDIVIMSLKQLINKNPDFKDLLLFVSLLDSQHIPRDLLNAYKGDDVVDSFIYNLKKYSLITNEITPSSQTEGTFSIHRSTQEISLNYLLKLLNLQKDSPLLSSIVTTLEKYLAHSVEKGDISTMRLLATHCEKILTHKDLLEITGILTQAGGIHRWLWNTENAENFLQKAIHNYKTGFPTCYSERGIALTYLGLFYRDNGQYQKAQNVLEEAVENFKKETNKNIWLGTSLVTLGNTYRDMGKYKDAEKYIEEGIAFYNENFPHHFFQIGVALSYLGAIERDLGNYEKARNLFEEGLKNYKKDSEDNVWYAWTLIHLAEIYRTLGNYEKALRLAEKSVSFYKETFAESSPNVAWALMLLGHVYGGLGDYEKSKSLLEKNLEICREVFGEDHMRTAKGVRWLAYTYRHLGEYEKAKKILMKILKVYQQHYGESHIQTARVLRNLGQVFLAQGHLEKSGNLLRHAMTIFQSYKCDDRYLCFENLGDLCLKRSAQKRKEGEIQQSYELTQQAVDYFVQSLDTLIKARFPADSPHISRMRRKLDKSKESLKNGLMPDF